ncbi:MAG TPA: Ig-like domain repeat protein [Thermoanaerobaculia bacterium]
MTFTATVSGDSPTGTVTFKDGANPMAGCSAVLLSGATAVCTTSTLSVGSHSITPSTRATRTTRRRLRRSCRWSGRRRPRR